MSAKTFGRSASNTTASSDVHRQRTSLVPSPEFSAEVPLSDTLAAHKRKSSNTSGTTTSNGNPFNDPNPSGTRVHITLVEWAQVCPFILCYLLVTTSSLPAAIPLLAGQRQLRRRQEPGVCLRPSGRKKLTSTITNASGMWSRLLSLPITHHPALSITRCTNTTRINRLSSSIILCREQAPHPQHIRRPLQTKNREHQPCVEMKNLPLVKRWRRFS